ncbi:hypothetical protein C8R44DRAFT_752168 [Mycena epipterygia]|nr:hypothetical protein C8R44DRAFT_752168 [Mycena epipterygia]
MTVEPKLTAPSPISPMPAQIRSPDKLHLNALCIKLCELFVVDEPTSNFICSAVNANEKSGMSSAATAPAATATARADTTGSNRASSRLAHLLASNDIPLDSEIPAIHHFISDNQSRYLPAAGSAYVLRIAMKKLIAERDRIQESVRKHAAIVSTVRRVPPDVMCQIFALTLPHTMRIHLLPVKRPPWRLGHICRSWRDWALADPFLWRSIVITQSPDVDLRDSHPSSMIETQLLRSRNVPLEVDFHSENCEDLDERRLWDFLLPQCHRWSIINLRCWRNPRPLFQLLDTIRGQVPQLKELRVYGLGVGRVSQPNCFSIAPNLREVTLTDPEYTNTLALCIPWSQITCYRGRFSALRQLEILEAASNLIECGLAFDDNGFGIPGDPLYMPRDTIITLPHLHRLYVGDGEFLTRLTAPVLEVLCSSGATDPLLDFANRSSCRLTRLVLEQCTSSDSVVRLLKDMPSLEYLLVEAWDWDSAAIRGFFDAMTISGASSDLCPSLSALAYGYGHASRLHSKSPSQLSSLRLFARPTSHSDFYKSRARFKESIAEGIKILADGGLDVALVDIYGEKALVAKYRP